jgi:hypothetical protein
MRRITPLLRFRSIALAASLVGLLTTALPARPDLTGNPIKQGLASLEKSDFQSADDHFRAAVSMSGPTAYREIGQAEAAIPGRELRAICWLAAYLAESPSAPDTKKIRATISALDARRREKNLLVIQCLAGAPITSPNPDDLTPQWNDGPSRAQEARDNVLGELVYRLANLHDFTGARQVIKLIHFPGSQSDAYTTLVRAESGEAARLYETGDAATSLDLLTNAQKDSVLTFPGIAMDWDRTYSVAMAQLQIARAAIRRQNFDEARHFIQLAGADDIDRQNADTQASIATTEIIVARAQLKSGDKKGAQKTLADAAKIAFIVKPTGAPLKYQTLRDLADAEIQASDLADARAALTAAVPLVVIYSDPDDSRLDLVKAQLLAGDKVGAQQTADLMKDAALKAKALAAIASHPAPPKPGDIQNAPPLPSQYLALDPGETPRELVTADTWMSLLKLNLDAPCFTAFRDENDVAAIADAIQHEPVRLARHAPELATLPALELVSRRMIDAQVAVDTLLNNQFSP